MVVRGASQRDGGAWLRRAHRRVARSTELVGERVLRIGFTVHEIHGGWRTGPPCSHRIQPALQLGAVAMRAVAVEDLHPSPKWDFFTEHANDGDALHDASA